MRRTDIAVVGGGQAGLAMSRCLGRLGLDHVVFERGRIAERWRSERWASLRLLTPNWMTRLPDGGYRGPDPDGFMTRDETADFLAEYGVAIAAPVEEHTAVLSVEATPGGFRMVTDRDAWSCRAIVIATGHADRPFVPVTARRLAPRIAQIVPTRYRTADQLPRGGVLVVGASSTGVQLAEEIQLSGRQVTLCVGSHAWLPRRYRGQDIMWWLDRLGMFDRAAEDVSNLEASRRHPSTQLVGSAPRRDISLGGLAGNGVRIVGRLAALDGDSAYLRRDLEPAIAAADARARRILAEIDAATGSEAAPLPRPWRPTLPLPGRIDLRQSGIRTVLWATGYRRELSWLRLPVLDDAGEIVHRGGICAVPGLYALGFNLLRRRASHFIDGVGRDAQALAAHIAGHLGAQQALAA